MLTVDIFYEAYLKLMTEGQPIIIEELEDRIVPSSDAGFLD